MRKLIIIGCLLVASGCYLSPTQRPAQSQVVAGANRAIEVAEELWICNANHVEETEETRHVVDSDGTVQLPLLGPVKIAGLRPIEAEKVITSQYTSRGFYRNAVVKILKKQKEPANKEIQPVAEKAGSS